MRRSSLGLFALACGAVFTLAPAAWAYSCISTTCGGYCQSPVPYRLGTPSADLGLAETEAEVKTGMEAWTKPACSSLKVQYGGTTSDAPGNGNGVVAWIESGWSSGSGTIGVTTSRLSRGCLTAHMIMNGVNFKWVRGAPAGRGQVNAFSIIAHEGGHYLGLGHSTASGAIMQAQYAGGVIALKSDDEAGICKIYSGGGGMAVPGAAGAGGGTGQNAGGSGGAPGGAKAQLCGACQVAADCASGTCLRNDNTGERFCGQPCTNGCPSGFRCVAVQGNANQCVPTNNTCSGVNVPGGGGAGGSAQGGAGGGTGSGAGGNFGGMGGMSAVKCSDDGDCEDGQKCDAERCVPDDDGQLVLPDGESCEVNEDCQSRLCVEPKDEAAFCSRACASNADCVSGFACRRHGDENICLRIDDQTPAEDERDEEKTAKDESSGCTMAPHRHNASPGWLLLMLAGFTFAGRRRCRWARSGAVGLLLWVGLGNGGCAGSSGEDDAITPDVSLDAAPSGRGGAATSPPRDPSPSQSGGRGGTSDARPPVAGQGGNPNAGSGGSPAGTGGASATGGTSMTPPPPAGMGGSAVTPAGCPVSEDGATGNEPGGRIPVCCVPAAADKVMIDEVFALLNAHRMANGRSALAYDAKLEQAIQGHCQHMAQHSFFSHAAPEAKVASFTSRATACGAAATGENIAFNQSTATQVMTSWKNSSGHNMNMLNAGYRRVGIGEYKLRWGQIFGR